jgi:ketosteroid isomerase-like protein
MAGEVRALRTLVLEGLPPDGLSTSEGSWMRAASWLGLLLLLGCATAGTASSPGAQARAGVDEGNHLLVAAALLGNGDRMATVFTDDATLLRNRAPTTLVGHAAIAAHFRAGLEGVHVLEFERTTLRLEASGDLAAELGTSRLKAQMGQAPPETEVGRYLAVWRRGPDGVWRISMLSTLSE